MKFLYNDEKSMTCFKVELIEKNEFQIHQRNKGGFDHQTKASFNVSYSALRARFF